MLIRHYLYNDQVANESYRFDEAHGGEEEEATDEYERVEKEEGGNPAMREGKARGAAA